MVKLSQQSSSDSANRRGQRPSPQQIRAQAQKYLKAGDTKSALVLYQQILLEAPDDPSTYSDLGVIFSRNWEFEKANDYFMKALSLSPDNTVVLNNYANSLQKQGRLEEAIETCERVLAQDPDITGTLLNKSIAHRKLGEFETTINLCERILRLTPDNPDAHFNIGFSKLYLGQWEEAWPEYEWRWQMSESRKSPPSQEKLWTGQSLQGKTLLVYNEQGFGDNIMMARFFQILRDQKATLIVKTRPELVRLMKHVKGLSQVYEQLPESISYDYQIPIFSLPYRLGISPDTIPNTMPYIKLGTNPLHIAAPKGKKLKVGLVWSTSKTNLITKTKSMPLEELLPLIRLEDIQYYSLQMDEQKQDLYQADFIPHLIDLSPYIKDFYDTAQIISHLDLVICVDTAVAHLAGALNKPVWTLLPSIPDWRWREKTSQSAWYPSMRLFKQTTRGQWSDVIEHVRQDLKKRMETL